MFANFFEGFKDNQKAKYFNWVCLFANISFAICVPLCLIFLIITAATGENYAIILMVFSGFFAFAAGSFFWGIVLGGERMKLLKIAAAGKSIETVLEKFKKAKSDKPKITFNVVARHIRIDHSTVIDSDGNRFTIEQDKSGVSFSDSQPYQYASWLDITDLSKLDDNLSLKHHFWRIKVKKVLATDPETKEFLEKQDKYNYEVHKNKDQFVDSWVRYDFEDFDLPCYTEVGDIHSYFNPRMYILSALCCFSGYYQMQMDKVTADVTIVVHKLFSSKGPEIYQQQTDWKIVLPRNVSPELEQLLVPYNSSMSNQQSNPKKYSTTNKELAQPFI
jgi:hypothetical protein